MALIDDVKLALRINSTTHNTEITDLINSAIADLTRLNIDATNTTVPLIKRAIVTYVKANFGYDNPDAQLFKEAYRFQVAELAMSDEYLIEEV